MKIMPSTFSHNLINGSRNTILISLENSHSNALTPEIIHNIFGFSTFIVFPWLVYLFLDEIGKKLIVSHPFFKMSLDFVHCDQEAIHPGTECMSEIYQQIFAKKTGISFIIQ